MNIREYFGLKEVKVALNIITRILRRWRYNFTEAKVYGILLLSPISLTIMDIANIANLSRSSISTVLSKLVKDYLVHYYRMGKTKYYTAIPALTEIFIKQPRETLEKEVIPLEKIIKDIHKKYLSDDRDYNKVIKDIENIRRKLEKCIEVLNE